MIHEEPRLLLRAILFRGVLEWDLELRLEDLKGNRGTGLALAINGGDSLLRNWEDNTAFPVAAVHLRPFGSPVHD